MWTDLKTNRNLVLAQPLQVQWGTLSVAQRVPAQFCSP